MTFLPKATWVAAGLALAGCVSDGSSQAQLAYDACTESWNSKVLHMSGHKAAVSGVSGSQTRCFWVWDQPSTSVAIQRAMGNCQAAMSSCFVYATDAGVNDWSRRISNNGGRDPDSAESDTDNGEEAALEMMNAMTGMISTMRRR